MSKILQKAKYSKQDDQKLKNPKKSTRKKDKSDKPNKAKQKNGGFKNPLWKVIITDLGGIGCLILVPFIGPLPGPGGIPLLITGFGLLAVNHDWADSAVDYVKEHSESLRNVLFPKIKWVQWSWDLFCLMLLGGGVWLNIYPEHWFWKALSYGVMASSTTLFMMNRDRVIWLDNQLRRTGKK